jgi:PST family polysaccharide transporter
MVFPWRPGLTIDFKLARGLLKYGIPVVGVNALTITTDTLDYLIIGRVFGNTALGIYTLAFRLPELLVLNPLWVMANAVFPAYASIQDQPEALRRGFLTTVRFVEIMSVPLSLGLMLVADPLVRVIFGEQWLEAIPIVRVLALFVLVRSIGFNAGDVYMAVGRPDILAKLELLNAVILVPALWVGTYFGLVWVAVGHLLAGIVRMVIDLFVAARFVNVSVKDILLQLKPSFISGVPLVFFVGSSLYLTTNVPPFIRLVLAITVGAVGYLGMLWFLERESLLRLARRVGLSRFGPAKKSAQAVTSPSSEGDPN